MMNHEHNPVAVRISRLQEKWTTATEQNQGYNLARWVIHNEDVDFLNGFLKLESSPHGKLDDFFVALFTPFSQPETFSKAIISDWLDMYREGIDKERINSQQQTIWAYQSFREKLKNLPQHDNGNTLLAELLHDFSRFASHDTRNLVLTLLPRSISDTTAYVKWMHSFLASADFSPSIKLAIVDYAGHDYFAAVHSNNAISTIAITVPDLNMRGAVSELAAMGNPNDPQVQFRICMTKMGEATGKNQRAALDHWGVKLLEAAQRTGSQGTFASGHLIYAGFLMHFNAKHETELMLLKAETIAKRAIREDDKNAVILIQIYGYMGALASMHGEHKEALAHFVKQAELAMSHSLAVNAISAYKTIIYICHTHGYTADYAQYVEQGYLTGLQVTDDELGVTDYAYIAYHYMEHNHYTKPDEVAALRVRMEKLFGVNWQSDLSKMFTQVEKQK